MPESASTAYVSEFLDGGVKGLFIDNEFVVASGDDVLTATARVLSYIALAEDEGQIVGGGARATGGDLAAGNLVQPIIVADVPRSARVRREEIFGPVVTVSRFENVRHAVQMANDTEYGLAAGI